DLAAVCLRSFPTRRSSDLVELAATETLAEAGQVPKEAAAMIRAKAKVDAARVNEIEARVKHDVIAFTMAVGESIGEPETARWLQDRKSTRLNSSHQIISYA